MKNLVFWLLITVINIFSQKVCRQFELLPSDFLYTPNFSNPMEAKFGFSFTLNDNKIQLDVGAAKEIFRYSFCEKSSFALGAEFFNWTQLKGEKDFTFPVIAVDYFFGIFISGKQGLFENRFRFSHISSHLADGNFDLLTAKWRDSLNPFVYSREFLEYSLSLDFDFLKPFIGITYLYHVKPNTQSKFILNLGTNLNLFELETIKTQLFTGFDIKYYQLYSSDYKKDISCTFGAKIGKSNASSLILFYRYYKGTNPNGPFSTFNVDHSSIGFNFIL